MCASSCKGSCKPRSLLHEMRSAFEEIVISETQKQTDKLEMPSSCGRKSHIPPGFKPQDETSRRNFLDKDDKIVSIIYNRSVNLTDKIRKDWNLQSSKKSQLYYILDVERQETRLTIDSFLEQ